MLSCNIIAFGQYYIYHFIYKENNYIINNNSKKQLDEKHYNISYNIYIAIKAVITTL